MSTDTPATIRSTFPPITFGNTRTDTSQASLRQLARATTSTTPVVAAILPGTIRNTGTRTTFNTKILPATFSATSVASIRTALTSFAIRFAESTFADFVAREAGGADATTAATTVIPTLPAKTVRDATINLAVLVGFGKTFTTGNTIPVTTVTAVSRAGDVVFIAVTSAIAAPRFAVVWTATSIFSGLADCITTSVGFAINNTRYWILDGLTGAVAAGKSLAILRTGLGVFVAL